MQQAERAEGGVAVMAVAQVMVVKQFAARLRKSSGDAMTWLEDKGLS